MATNSMMLSSAFVELAEAIEIGNFIEARQLVEDVDHDMAKLRAYVAKKLASQ